jgi:uncharacterized membrane-anchored protein YjiN (DUF445 family)
MDKRTELKQSKGRAGALLVAVALVFVAAALAPRSLAVDCVRTAAEAAMVGALADWFAVVALFRRVPIPLVQRHTAIIPQNQARIADNLAVFVQDKFLDPDSLVALLRRHDPAARAEAWLTDPGNTEALGRHALRLVGATLDVVDDARVQAFLRESLRRLIDRLDLASASAGLLDTLTRDGRHQQLLDGTLAQVLTLLRTDASRTFIARQIVDWLRADYPKLERLLPTEYIGDKGADVIADALDRMLQRVGADPQHELRQGFDRLVGALVARLRTDPDFIAKAEELKLYLRDGEPARAYVAGLWGELRDWLRRDAASGESQLQRQAAAAGAWLGKELAGSADLRASLNEHLHEAARAMAPDFAAFLTRHISDTVRRWDPHDLADQVELNIGKDLQYIRINGTVVGGAVGFGLFWLAWALERVPH